MSFADAFAKGSHPVKKAATAPKAEAAQKPDDGLDMLRRVAAQSHGKRKLEYEAALKKADSKKV